MKTLLLIPAYNEQESIVHVAGQLRENYPQYDFLILNDGSSDKTGKLCREAGFPMLDLPVNLGLSGAFQAGMKYAHRKGYDCVVQFDADGQHLPEYIQPLLWEIEQGCDIAIASRFVDVPKPKNLRMAGSYLIALMIWITTGCKLTDPTSGMRAFNKKMIHQFATRINYGPEPDTISFLIKNGARVIEIQAQMQERLAGQSYFTLLRSARYMLYMSCSILLFQWMRK